MPVTFDATLHRYEMDGLAVPGITSILRAGGLIEGMRWDDAAMLRGTYVHEATELYDRGTLDETTLDPVIRPYLDAWIKAKRECELEVLEIEALKSHPVWRYATKIDRIVRWRKCIAVINLKSGAAYPWHPIQLAGEALLMENARDVARLAVYLDGNGNYKVTEYAALDDLRIFRACLDIFWWKELSCPTLH